MKRPTPFLLAAVLLLAGACDTQALDVKEAQASSSQGLPDRDPSLARRLVREEGALLLDVRSQGEFDSGHVDGAKLIPHTEIDARIDEVLQAQGGDKHKPIVVYCRSGRRSGMAKKALVGHGFDQVTNLGGMNNWCEDC
jgi:phage shock protein E